MKSLITLTRNGKKRDTTWDHYIKQSKSDSERQVCFLLYEDSGYICMYIYSYSYENTNGTVRRKDDKDNFKMQGWSTKRIR